MRRFIKTPYIVSALAIGGFASTALTGNSQPIFNDLDTFVLFAEKEIILEQELQISSGDIGSNNNIDIQKDAIINSNLFADNIILDKNIQINGNTSFNNLKTQKDTQILGTQTTPVSLPIANILGIPSFQSGTQDISFTGQGNTLPAGDFRNITLNKNSTLTLTGGAYNISKLTLKDDSTIIYSTPTTLNIKQEFKTQQNIAILPGQNLKPNDLSINYQGSKDKEGIKPILFGNNSFLNFKLLAPDATVNIGDNITLRGQVVARKIKVGKNSVLSTKEFFTKTSDFDEAILDDDGSRFFVNELIINFKDEATLLNAQNMADQVDGRIIGFIRTTNVYQIEVFVNSLEDLETKIQFIRQLSDPLIEGVFRNYILNIF